MTGLSKTARSFPLRLPASVRRRLEQVAANDGVSINQFITLAVAEKLSVMQAADYWEAKAAKADPAMLRALLSRSGGQPPLDGDERQVSEPDQ